MKRKSMLATLALIVCLATLPALSLAEGTFGSAAVVTGQTYTVSQMLTYALQDEYMAQAEYNAIIDVFGNNAPFSNIARAEATHQALLLPLFESYAVPVPENTAATQTVVPATVEDAYTAGISAENANIAMYRTFLAQADLPDDVRNVFTLLTNASQNHLAAFTRNSERGGLGMRNGMNSANGQYGCGGNRNNTLCNGTCIIGGTQSDNNNRQGGRGGNRN